MKETGMLLIVESICLPLKRRIRGILIGLLILQLLNSFGTLTGGIGSEGPKALRILKKGWELASKVAKRSGGLPLIGIFLQLLTPRFA